MSDEAFTVFCRNLSEEVTESILYELFLQAGPVEDVRIPTQDGKNRSYGFVVFKHKCSVKYAIDLFQDTKLYGRYIALQNRLLDAEREAEMRNKWCHNRNEDYDSLRGGPPPSRYNDMNSLRGGMSSYSRNDDDMNPLRGGGSMNFSRMDNMAPRGFSNSPYRQSPKQDRSSFDARSMNPYGSSLGSFMPDSRGSSYDNRSNRSYENDLRNFMSNHSKLDRYQKDDINRDHSRNDSRSRDYDRNDRHRLDTKRDRNRDHDRNRRRSRSRDRSPQRSYDRHRRR